MKYPRECPCNDCFNDENEWVPCFRWNCKDYKKWKEKVRKEKLYKLVKESSK